MIWKRLSELLRGNPYQADLQTFRLGREQLEAKFLELAASSGKPRGLRWISAEWLPGVQFAVDRNTQMLTAFASVNLRFEAIEGGDMEDVDAVSTVRDACALFHCQGGVWGTGGRALFNMDPKLALERFSEQYEPLEDLPSSDR